MGVHEIAHAQESFSRDAAAIPQPVDKLAVIDGAASERRFGKPGTPTIVRDFSQQLFCMHESACVDRKSFLSLRYRYSSAQFG
jgi:hypothetical protein